MSGKRKKYTPVFRELNRGVRSRMSRPRSVLVSNCWGVGCAWPAMRPMGYSPGA